QQRAGRGGPRRPLPVLGRAAGVQRRTGGLGQNRWMPLTRVDRGWAPVVAMRMVIGGGSPLTGRVGRHSTAGLAVVAAATLADAQLAVAMRGLASAQAIAARVCAHPVYQMPGLAPVRAMRRRRTVRWRLRRDDRPNSR